MVGLDAGDHDARRVEVQEVPAVFAGLRHEVTVPLHEGRSAAELRNLGPDEDRGGHVPLLEDGAAHRRRG